jgi:hypothetical protein
MEVPSIQWRYNVLIYNSIQVDLPSIQVLKYSMGGLKYSSIPSNYSIIKVFNY